MQHRSTRQILHLALAILCGCVSEPVAEAASRNRFEIQKDWFMDLDFQAQNRDSWVYSRRIHDGERVVGGFTFVCPYKHDAYMQIDLPENLKIESIPQTEMSQRIELVVNNELISAGVEKRVLYVDRTPLASRAFDFAFGGTSNEIELRFRPYGEVILLNVSDKLDADLSEKIVSKNGVAVDFNTMWKSCEDFKGG